MDHITYAAGVAVLVAIAAAGAWFAAHAVFSWYSRRVIGTLVERHGCTPGCAWGLHAFVALMIASLFIPKSDDDAAAQRLANGVYGATVIRCYQMSDFELSANETLCRDALRRVKN